MTLRLRMVSSWPLACKHDLLKSCMFEIHKVSITWVLRQSYREQALQKENMFAGVGPYFVTHFRYFLSLKGLPVIVDFFASNIFPFFWSLSETTGPTLLRNFFLTSFLRPKDAEVELTCWKARLDSLHSKWRFFFAQVMLLRKTGQKPSTSFLKVRCLSPGDDFRPFVLRDAFCQTHFAEGCFLFTGENLFFLVILFLESFF